MVIAVWQQVLGGSCGGLEDLGAAVAWCQRCLAQRADQSWVLAEGGAGQALAAVGAGAHFVVDLAGGAGGDLLVIQVRVMAWSRRPVVAVMSGPGRAGQYQVPPARMAPPAFAWTPGVAVRLLCIRPQ